MADLFPTLGFNNHTTQLQLLGRVLPLLLLADRVHQTNPPECHPLQHLYLDPPLISFMTVLFSNIYAKQFYLYCKSLWRVGKTAWVYKLWWFCFLLVVVVVIASIFLILCAVIISPLPKPKRLPVGGLWHVALILMYRVLGCIISHYLCVTKFLFF